MQIKSAPYTTTMMAVRLTNDVNQNPLIEDKKKEPGRLRPDSYKTKAYIFFYSNPLASYYELLVLSSLFKNKVTSNKGFVP